MTILGLKKFLKTRCPHVFKEQEHISKYRFKKVAIDTSIYMYAYKPTLGKNWLSGFARLVNCFRKNDVHCCFVFDTAPPPEKESTIKKRKEQKEKQDEKISIFIDALHKLDECDTMPELPKIVSDKLGENVEIHDAIRIIKGIIEKYTKNSINITENDWRLLREFLGIAKIPCIDARKDTHGQGEGECARLARSGKVDAVMTKDIDALAYCCPRVITNINTASGFITEICIEDILTALEFTENEFRDFCIMCGTDYNENIPKIGPVNAYKLMKKFHSIDEISKIQDVSILKHNIVRDILTSCDLKSDDEVSYCGFPDLNVLKNFISEYELCNLDLSYTQPRTMSLECNF